MTEDPPKVLVIGFGGLGALYSWLLTKGGAQIYALARSNAQSLSTRGIDINSIKYGKDANFKPHKVLSSPEQVQEYAPYDYILCTMKIVPEEEASGQLILRLLGGKGDVHSRLPQYKKPTIVFVENGIGIEEEPHQTLCQGDDAVAGGIISCCAWLGANLVNGGTQVDHGGIEMLQMGLYPAPDPKDDSQELAVRKEKLKIFADTYIKGGGGALRIDGDIQPLRWKKIYWNTAWGGLSTLARQPVSVLLQDDNLQTSSETVRKIMLEVMYVARACGYDEKALPASDLDEIFNLTYSQAPSNQKPGHVPNLAIDFKPSLLLDLEAKRGMELTPIIGNIVKKGREHRVDTPRLEMILAALRPSLLQAVQRSRSSS